jgi:hypothetical protein
MSTVRRALAAAWVVSLTAVAATQSMAATDPPAIKMPRAGCATFTDPTGDSTPPGGNDPDLDLTQATFASPPGKIRAFIHVDKLGSPSLVGHVYDATFVLSGKVVALVGGADVTGVDTLHHASSGVGFGRPLTDVTYDAVTVPDATLDVVFDEAGSTVVLTTDRAPIEKAAKTSLADGVTVSGVAAHTYTDAYVSFGAADTAPKGVAPDKSTYTIGDNRCFEPPKGHLTLKAPAGAVFGHPVPVGGVLTDDAGKPVMGKKVTVTTAGKPVDVTTDAAGAFSEQLAGTLTAGSYLVTAAFGGDDTLGQVQVSAPLVVRAAPSSIALTAVASGKQVIIKAQLLNDRRLPIANQVVTWYVDSKAVRTARTDSAGRTSFTTAPKHTVKITYVGWKGRYLASQASRKV